MLPNEVFALECLQRYAENGDIVDETNGEFAHCPLPQGMGEKGYYLTHEDHQPQGLLQSKDLGRLCFYIGQAHRWLLNCDPMPANYFELWGIYDEFAGENARKLNKTLHGEKNEFGRSVLGVKAADRLHREKDENGKSVQAMKWGKKGGKKIMEEKNEDGKSKHAVKIGRLSGVKGQKMVELTRVEDGEVFVFESLQFAGEVLGVFSQSLSMVCKGKRKTVGGYTARYLA
jgi:hypothetical protein